MYIIPYDAGRRVSVLEGDGGFVNWAFAGRFDRQAMGRLSSSTHDARRSPIIWCLPDFVLRFKLAVPTVLPACAASAAGMQGLSFAGAWLLSLVFAGALFGALLPF